MVTVSNHNKTKKNKKLLDKLMKRKNKTKKTKKITGKSKKNKQKSKKVVPKKFIDGRPDLKIPTYRPNKLKIGTIKKGRDNKLWKVVSFRTNGMNVKKWVRATTMDIKCNNYLQNSVKHNIMKYKSNNKSYKSLNQAIAIAYAMTKKKFPKCLLINSKNKK